VRVVPAEQTEYYVRLAVAAAIPDLQAALVFTDDQDLWIGTGTGAKVDCLSRKITAELRHVGIVAIEECNAVGGQRSHQFKLRARNAGLAIGKILHVGRAYIGDDAPIGSGNSRQGGNLTGVVHAHFDYGELVFRLQAQKLQRQSIGFLWYNAHPAEIFMGDVGSLALGGAIGTVAVIIRQELLLPFIGGIFVIEALSVMLQVGSYKLRKKRIFKMAPLHHHFEQLGWSESKVIVRFWILALIFALIALTTLKLR